MYFYNCPQEGAQELEIRCPSRLAEQAAWRSGLTLHIIPEKAEPRAGDSTERTGSEPCPLSLRELCSGMGLRGVGWTACHCHSPGGRGRFEGKSGSLKVSSPEVFVSPVPNFSYDQPRQHIKKQRRYCANKGPSSQGYGFSSSHVWM